MKWYFILILYCPSTLIWREFFPLIYNRNGAIDRGLTEGIFSVIIGCKRNNVKKNKLVMSLLSRRKSKPDIPTLIFRKLAGGFGIWDLPFNRAEMGFPSPHQADIKMTNKYHLWLALHSGKKLIDGVPSGSCRICEKGRKIENGMPCPSVRLFYDRASKTIYSLSVADFEILMHSKRGGVVGPDFNHFCFEWVRYV